MSDCRTRWRSPRPAFAVLGIDVNGERVAAVNRGQSQIPDVPSEQLAPLVAAGRLSASSDYARLVEADVMLICVPTPFDDMKTPDLRYIVAAAQGIAAASAARPAMVILQSTTYPGTTEEVVQPILERSGLQAGQRLSPGLLAGAHRSGQPPVQRAQHPQGGGRADRAVYRAGLRAVRRT